MRYEGEVKGGGGHECGRRVLLTYRELVPEVMSKDTYQQSKKRGKLQTLGRGGNGRTVEVYFDSLPAKYMRKALVVYGDLDAYIAKSNAPKCWCEMLKDTKDVPHTGGVAHCGHTENVNEKTEQACDI